MKVCSQRMNFLNLLELDCNLCLTTHVLEAASRLCHDVFSVPYLFLVFLTLFLTEKQSLVKGLNLVRIRPFSKCDRRCVFAADAVYTNIESSADWFRSPRIIYVATRMNTRQLPSSKARQHQELISV